MLKDNLFSCKSATYFDRRSTLVRPNSSIQQFAAVMDWHGKTCLQHQVAPSDREIDALVYELYGLSDQEIALVENATR